MIVVVGAGAAGLTAAIFAATGGHPVTVIESTADGGRKILISGGGRCNVLPDTLAPQRFVTDSPPPLVRRFLRSWPLREQRAFFENDLGIALALEAESSKWFPASNRARDVRDGLVGVARRRGATFQFNTELIDVVATDDGLRVQTSRGDIDASAVVLATGGLSVPATGSTGTGLRVARALGHTVHEPYAALTPLLLTPSNYGHLSGISLDVRIRARSAEAESEAEGGFLFTHRGFSGPSVLDVSHVAVRSLAPGRPLATLRVRWSDVDEARWHRELIGSTGLVANAVAEHIPRRLAEHLLVQCGLPADLGASELTRADRVKLVSRLTGDELAWTGHEGYKKAEVTGGGVALDELDPATLESRRRRGLFLCGEMLDAFGPIGGHNFAWAWATGRLAGLGAAAQL